MTRALRLTLLAACSATAFSLAAGAASAQTYDRVVVFGDSLSDNGNLYRATNRTQPPSPPYFQGRFSNGPTFIEVLFPNQNPFGSTTGNVNNAFGGARTDLQQNPPSLPIQLQAYTAAGGRFGSRDLVSVLGGANNILQGIPGAAANPTTAQAVIGGIATNAAADIGALTRSIAAAGAGTILVGNLPNIGATPQLAGPAAPLGSFATDTFNGALRQQLFAAAGGTGANIILADYNRASEFVRLNPAPFGFSNTTQTCLNATTGAVCANPDTFFFFDGVHPTAAAHRLLANVAADYLYYGRLAAPTVLQAETGLDHRDRAFDAALDGAGWGLAEGEADTRVVLDLGANELDARGDVPEAESDFSALRFTAAGGLSSDLTVGLSAAYARSDVSVGPQSFETTTISGDVFVGWRSPTWFAGLTVGGGFDEYQDIRRLTSVAPAVHEADTTGWNAGFSGEVGYRFPLGAGTIAPILGVDYAAASVEGYQEDGPMARHDIQSRDVDDLSAQLSVRYETAADARWGGFIEGGYEQSIAGEADDVVVGLVDNPASLLATEIDGVGASVATLDAGVSGVIGGGLSVSANFRGRYGDGFSSSTGMLSVGLAF